MVSQTESQIIKYLSTTQNRLNLILRLLEKRTMEETEQESCATNLENSKQSPETRTDFLIVNLLGEISDQIIGISRYMNFIDNLESDED